MKSTLKLTALALMPLALTCCGSSALTESEAERLNSSSLYDPPSVVLVEGRPYRFAEGVLTGRGQRFYSQHAFSTALAVGRDRSK